MEKKPLMFSNEPFYSNCLIIAPDGQPLSRVGRHRVDWYLEKDLAELVDDTDGRITIRLKFEPSGRKSADHPYTCSVKENKCVCCGSEEEITAHHVVPRVFRKYFPVCRKNRNPHDILPLCCECHHVYEKEASKLKTAIAKELGLKTSRGYAFNKDLDNAVGAARSLLKYSKVIPSDRKEFLLNRVRHYLKKDEISEEDLRTTAKSKSAWIRDGKTYGELVVEHYKDNIQDFIIRWRKHFVDTMSPQFMQEHWDVENDL